MKPLYIIYSRTHHRLCSCSRSLIWSRARLFFPHSRTCSSTVFSNFLATIFSLCGYLFWFVLFSSASSFQLSRKFAAQSEKENEIFEYVTGVDFFSSSSSSLRIHYTHPVALAVSVYVCVCVGACIFIWCFIFYVYICCIFLLCTKDRANLNIFLLVRMAGLYALVVSPDFAIQPSVIASLRNFSFSH